MFLANQAATLQTYHENKLKMYLNKDSLRALTQSVSKWVENAETCAHAAKPLKGSFKRF